MTTSTSPMCSPTRRAHTRWIALPILGALFAPATALAGNKEDAKAHVANATRAHKEARYDDARAELEAAYRLDPQPELLYALGQVDAKLGRCDEAIAYYQRFAATQRDPQVARVIDQAIAACTPGPPEPGGDGTRSTPQDTPPGGPGAQGAPAAPGAQGAPATAEVRPERWYRDKLGGALVAGGAVATVLALIEYRSALSDLDAAGDRTATRSLDRYHELVDSAHGKRMASLILAGAGSALITAGVIRYVIHSRTLETGELAIAPARGGGIVSYGGRF